MKTERVELFRWWSRDDVITVDWPKVHKEIGVEQVSWLLKQPKEECQLVVDKLNENFALVAEFYSDKKMVEYWLRWAK